MAKKWAQKPTWRCRKLRSEAFAGPPGTTTSPFSVLCTEPGRSQKCATVGIGVAVGLAVADGVGVADGVEVALCVGEALAVGRGDGDAVAVALGVAVFVGT